jgi:hypothetical protein
MDWWRSAEDRRRNVIEGAKINVKVDWLSRVTDSNEMRISDGTVLAHLCVVWIYVGTTEEGFLLGASKTCQCRDPFPGIIVIERRSRHGWSVANRRRITKKKY